MISTLHNERIYVMSQIDQAVIDISGMGVREIAKTLGKSRQAVDRGVRGEGKQYFRPDDMQKIYSSVCTNYPARKDQFGEFIRQKYTEFASFIIIAAAKGNLDAVMAQASECVIFVHDFEQFRIDLPQPFETITKLIHSDALKLTFITSSRRSGEDIDAFGKRLKGEAWSELRPTRISIRRYEITRHMPVMIIFNPSSDARAFVTTFEQFAPLGEFQARRLAANLEMIGDEVAEEILSNAG